MDTRCRDGLSMLYTVDGVTPARIANSFGRISRWSQSCSKRLATASITVMMKFTSIGWYRSSCGFTYAVAYIVKVFYAVENMWLRNDKEYI